MYETGFEPTVQVFNKAIFSLYFGLYIKFKPQYFYITILKVFSQTF
jgi:hypothetical protein